MALPAIHALQVAGWPCALVGKAWGESLFAGLRLPYVVIEGRAFADRTRVRALRRTKGDVCGLILPNSFGSALGFALAGVPSAGLAGDGRRMLLRWPIQDPGPLHEVERFHTAAVGALRAWGSRGEYPVPTDLGLPVTGEHEAHAQKDLREQGVAGAYALLAPIATGLHHGQVKHWAHFRRSSCLSCSNVDCRRLLRPLPRRLTQCARRCPERHCCGRCRWACTRRWRRGPRS